MSNGANYDHFEKNAMVTNHLSCILWIFVLPETVLSLGYSENDDVYITWSHNEQVKPDKC